MPTENQIPGRIQFLSPSDPLWGEYLRAVPHDIYSSPAYHGFMQEQERSEARLAVAGSRERFLAWPFLLRRIEPGSAPSQMEVRDATTVYGYSGPLAFGCTPGDPFLPAAWKSLVAGWRAYGIVSLFCRFHPLLENQIWIEHLRPSCQNGAAVPQLTLTLRGRTVSLDLARTDEQAWAEYRENHRRHIHRARQCGLSWEADEAFAHLPDFARLYHDTMRRNAAAAEYLYSTRYFDELRRRLPSAIFLHLARAGGQVAAAVLVSEYQGIVQYLFGGVDHRFLDLSPLKFLLEAVRKWGRSRGNRVLHLGGGRGGREDSLFHFKAGFSSRRHPFYTGQCILDPVSYRAFSEMHSREAGQLAKALDPDYFPVYRAPFTQLSEEQAAISIRE